MRKQFNLIVLPNSHTDELTFTMNGTHNHLHPFMMTWRKLFMMVLKWTYYYVIHDDTILYKSTD